MKDLMNMMKAASEMKSKMEAMQDSLASISVVGKAGGDLVTVTLSGKGELKGVKIDPSLLRADEGEVLEDLLVAAHADAKAKAEAEMNTRMQEVTAGLPLPPGLKFPF